MFGYSDPHTSYSLKSGGGTLPYTVPLAGFFACHSLFVTTETFSIRDPHIHIHSISISVIPKLHNIQNITHMIPKLHIILNIGHNDPQTTTIVPNV